MGSALIGSRGRSLVCLAVVSAVTCIAAVILYLGSDPVWLFHREELRAASEVVQRVETYRLEHKRLPGSLQDLGYTDPKTLEVYYQKMSETEYYVWFGLSVGESYVYKSDRKEWLIE